MIASPSSWDSIDDSKYQNEVDAARALLAAVPVTTEERAVIVADAVSLVRAARAETRKQGVVESFLQEFSLGTREGLALMCLAEALLRTPDAETRDRLIAEKIGSADWASHLGQSDSLFVNASTWGLMLTGRLAMACRSSSPRSARATKRCRKRACGTNFIRACAGWL